MFILQLTKDGWYCPEPDLEVEFKFYRDLVFGEEYVPTSVFADKPDERAPYIPAKDMPQEKLREFDQEDMSDDELFIRQYLENFSRRDPMSCELFVHTLEEYDGQPSELIEYIFNHAET